MIKAYMEEIGAPDSEKDEAHKFLVEKAIKFSMKENVADFERYICEK